MPDDAPRPSFTGVLHGLENGGYLHKEPLCDAKAGSTGVRQKPVEARVNQR